MTKLFMTLIAALGLGVGLAACDPKPQPPKAAFDSHSPSKPGML